MDPAILLFSTAFSADPVENRTALALGGNVEAHLVDWSIIAAYFLFNLAIGFYYKRRAGASTGDFFLSGRNVPWWLAGTYGPYEAETKKTNLVVALSVSLVHCIRSLPW